ncbi:hypothetical protein [Paenibacillus xylaniclasticus]|uniref:hypothetical protein n=1 Tax=Paenibacillus xylaniclasticus TaxID=588083 RepID=UPI000FD99029|nr:MULTISPECIES: hypothetical protein [Paenibacillus]GFN30055.1 hypothetical protein PCURB6_03150 [Paenibacillus curdlanolyticus]
MIETTLKVKYEQTPSTIAQALHALVQHTDKADLSLSEVMGYTSHAFRINVRAHSIETDSIYSFHGGPALERNLTALGFKPLILCPPVKTITPELLAKLIDTIRERLRQGFPIVGWDLLAKEFGIIYGFDDSKGIFLVKDSAREGVIPYHELPNRKIICLATVEESLATDRKTMLMHALDAIIEHAYSRDGLSFLNLQSGLQGYEAWIEALISGDKISNKGNAFNLHVISDARSHAAKFLEIVSDEWTASPYNNTEIGRLALYAAAHYANVAERLAEMKTIYPYPINKKSASPRLKDDNNLRSIEILKQAMEEEKKGIILLQEMRSALSTLNHSMIASE